MNTRSIAVAFAAAALSMPGVAFAQAMSGDHAMAHDSAMMGTMLCRAAHAGEKPTAMTVGGDKGIVCKTIQPDMMIKSHGPKITPSMTSEQVDAAWREYLQQISVVPGGTGGG